MYVIPSQQGLPLRDRYEGDTIHKTLKQCRANDGLKRIGKLHSMISIIMAPME